MKPTHPARGARTWIAALAAVLAALVVAGAAAASPAATERASSGFTAEQTSAIDAIVNQMMSEQRIPGVSVGVYAPGKSYEASYGVSDLATGAATDPADAVRIASISKTFTAVAVLRLVVAAS